MEEISTPTPSSRLPISSSSSFNKVAKPPRPQSSRPSSSSSSATRATDQPHPPQPSRFSSPDSSSTYVVQVPRDQVFGAPPLENAYHVPRPASPGLTRHSRCSCCCCISWCCGVFFMLIVLLAVLALVFYLVVSPKNPLFSVEGVVITNLKTTRPKFSITMSIRNPSAQLGYAFKSGSVAVLSYADSTIAQGKLPGFYNRHGENSTVETLLFCYKKKLPSVINRSLSGPVGAVVPMRLSLNYMAKWVLSGGIESFAWVENVECDVHLRVSSKGSRVLHHQCNAAVTFI